MTKEELEQIAEESYKQYSKDKCIDTYEGYQYIDGFSEGYKQGQKDTFNIYDSELTDISNDYSFRLKKLVKEQEELKAQNYSLADTLILKNEQIEK